MSRLRLAPADQNPPADAADPQGVADGAGTASEADGVGLTPAGHDGTTQSDRDLLGRFVQDRDRVAFGEIVARYQRLVMGVALRQVGDRHRAEDVFQATFLVLAQRASRIRKPESLAAWLHGAARRIGLQALADIRLTDMPASTPEPAVESPVLEELQAAFERQTLDAEIDRLPEKYRLPLVLHYLEGMTGKDVAERLGMSVDTVEGRLKQGRNRLRERLLRHGIGLGVLLTAFQATQSTAVASTAALIEATTAASLAWVNRHSLEACSANAARLAGKELAVMSATKTTTLIACTATLCLGTGVLGALTFADSRGSGDARSPAVSTVAGEDGATELNLASTTAGDAGELPRITVRVPEGTPDLIVELDGAGAMAPGGKTSYTGFSPAREDLEQVLDLSLRELGAAPDSMQQQESLATKLSSLSSLLQVPIAIDNERLEELGFTANMDVGPIVAAPQARLRDVLMQMLEPHDLDCVIRHDVLTITTAEYANQFTELVVYEARDLERLIPSDKLKEMIIAETGHENTSPWMESHGAGGQISSIPGALVVRQTQRGHQDVARLLKQLREFAARSELPQPAQHFGGTSSDSRYSIPKYRGGSLFSEGGGGFF